MPALKNIGDAQRGRLNRKQAADYLGFSPRTLADWHRTGTGPISHLISGRRFYRLEEINKLINENQRR